jgi:nucleotide-binding universal stress UspA family protein
MYKHILVALDHSPLSDEVLKQAIILAKSVNASLHLLHVLSPSEEMRRSLPMMPLPEYYPALSIQALELYQEEWQKVQSQNLAALKRDQTEAEAVGVKADSRQLLGRPGPAICSAAAELAADLIMVGRRGHSVFDELLLGSVSSYVIHHASCAVLVCNPQPKQLSKAVYESPAFNARITSN